MQLNVRLRELQIWIYFRKILLRPIRIIMANTKAVIYHIYWTLACPSPHFSQLVIIGGLILYLWNHVGQVEWWLNSEINRSKRNCLKHNAISIDVTCYLCSWRTRVRLGSWTSAKPAVIQFGSHYERDTRFMYHLKYQENISYSNSVPADQL